jgi:hypothetical protein
MTLPGRAPPPSLEELFGVRRDQAGQRLLRQRGRLSSYCKNCQRRVSNDAYRRRRQDAAERERMRQLDRARKRAERARLEQVDPGRERRAGQARTAAVRRLIATYEPEYRALLAAERARREADHRQEEVARGA